MEHGQEIDWRCRFGQISVYHVHLPAQAARGSVRIRRFFRRPRRVRRWLQFLEGFIRSLGYPVQVPPHVRVFLILRCEECEQGSGNSDGLASGGSTSPRVVIEAVTYERHFGHDITRCRRMLYQTVNSVVDEAHVLFEYFIQFEREEGTLNELNKALEKVNNQVKRLHERGEHIKKKRVHPVPQKKKKLENGSTVAQKSPAKRKIVEEEPAVPAKKPETVRDKDGFVMPTLPVNRPMKKAKTEPQPIEEMEVDSELEANVEKSEVVTEANGESSDQPVSEEVKERAKNNKDRTVFVSNLVYDVSKEQLAALFDNIDTIRLAGAKGLINHKGYGYIDFKTVDDASRALLKDRTPLNGRPVFVSLNKKKEKSKDDPSVDKRKLFVSNVHFECTDQDVKDVFMEFGNVVRVLIAKKASGTPKGCAYVDFDTQEAGEKAVGATKLKLRGRPLNIVYNKPPKKQKENHSVKTARHKRIDPKGSAGIFTRKEEASSADTNGSNMSNDEFRRFL
ncbi:hypothetical protein L596_004719 [Steinernema carpocapsae]|uniref:RRM domain-containing protein n=1 Tax=Steinernema carpocapsae TaxID=34508 RepID=A0A4U8UYA5_STECR|nr:hypothetical protein L596_004719 [Steinernema carpocapsae]